MQTTELKNTLIQRIKAIEDKSFLNALKILTDSKITEETYQLNEFEEQKIAVAREQVRNGKTYTQEEVFEKVNSWLKEK